MANSFMLRRFERLNGRAYTVNYKYLLLAYIIELVVVGTSLLGAWHFTIQYGENNSSIMIMMALAPIAYACVELARVPLAFALRTQTALFWKIFFALMVLAAAAVTVKSLSQLGEIMFRPRLHDVTTKATFLQDAKFEQQSVKDKISAADELVYQRRLTLITAEDRVKSVTVEMARLGAPQCTKISGTDKSGQPFSGQKCTSDPRVPVMERDLKDAQHSREAAAGSVTDAQVQRGKLDLSAVDKKVAAAETAMRHAIMDSQLHSFTAMFFGKSPLEVTDAEIHFFMRWFVFFPAIFAALTATALALASVTYDPKPKSDLVSITLDSRAGDYILDPLAEIITEKAVKAALEAVSVGPETSAVRKTEEKTVAGKATASISEGVKPERSHSSYDADPSNSSLGDMEKVVPLKGAALNG